MLQNNFCTGTHEEGLHGHGHEVILKLFKQTQECGQIAVSKFNQQTIDWPAISLHAKLVEYNA